MRVFTADMNGNQERMLNVEVGGPLGYYSHFRTSGKQNSPPGSIMCHHFHMQNSRCVCDSRPHDRDIKIKF